MNFYDMFKYYDDSSFYKPQKRSLTENQMRVKRIKKKIMIQKAKKRKGKK